MRRLWQLWRGLKTGEKVLFGGIGVFVVIAVQNFIALEWYRSTLDHPLYPVRTHYDFAGDGFHGSELFRTYNCTLCHKAVGNGTNMGLGLDGIGSRQDVDRLYRFLKEPEATYGSRTVDHGPSPKEAAYVAALPDADLHAIAVFLSQLKADRGAPAAQEPPKEKSNFIDAMLEMWAPDSWRAKFGDVRDADKPAK